MRKCLLIIVLVLFRAFFAQATDVSGPVSGVWDPSGNPYNLVDSVWVPYGQTLTILPGVNVDWVTNGTVFSAYGRLQASGTAGQPIDMTSQANSYLNLNLLGTGADSDLLEWVTINGKIGLQGSGHALDHIVLTHGGTSAYGIYGLGGMATDISISNSYFDVHSAAESTASAQGIYQINGQISNCTLDVNACSFGSYFPTAYAVGFKNCQGTFSNNRVTILSDDNNGGLSKASGIENCTGIKRGNIIWAKALGEARITTGITDGSGEAINNTIFLEGSEGSNGWGITQHSTILNNIVQNASWNGTAINIGGTVHYNTLWGFTTYFVSASADTLGNLIEDPHVNWNTGLLEEQSRCINHGDPDSTYNDPDGTRNDRGFMPFNPGNYANFVASQNSLDFGLVPIGGSRDIIVTFTNVGLLTGEMIVAIPSHRNYRVVSGIPSGPIAPGATHQVTIRFAPVECAAYGWEEVEIIPNMGPIPPYFIELWGEATYSVSGNITGPVTWPAAYSPIYMVGGVNVLPGGSLTIEPGVEIRVMGPYHLYAAGGLSAVGTPSDSIRFIPDGSSIHWYGIDIEDGPGAKDLAYCVIEGCIGDPFTNGNGGAVHIIGESMSLTHCRISGNSAQAGAGVYCDGGMLTFQDNLLTENTASGGDSLSIICSVNSTISFSGNYLMGNTAADGALFASGGVLPTFVQNLFAGTSGIGAKIVAANLPLFDLSTFTDNVIGLQIQNPIGQSFAGRNLILYGNGSGTPAEQFSISGGTATLTYCDIQGGWVGIGNINADPLFVNPESGDYHLQSEAGSYHGGQWLPDSLTSPCIDAGDPASAYNLEPEPNGNRVNMGLYGNTTQASLSTDDPQYVSGAVSGTWTAALSPRFVMGDIFVPSNDSLVIEPGVDVIFMGPYKFSVPSGALLRAVGTQQDSILFTADNPTLGWQGLRFTNASANCRLEYCHITRGKAMASGYQTGGGIKSSCTSLTISHCLIDSCYALGNGGGICGGGLAVLSYTDILGNTAEGYGGGIHNPGYAIISYCNISGNTAALSGGGIDSGNPVIDHCIISNNHADWGGGIYYMLDNYILSYCLISGNTSYSKGGGICIENGAELTIQYSCIVGNSTTGSNGYGGGIYCETSDIYISHSSILENSSERGGGLYIGGSYNHESDLSNVTVCGNTATYNGGVYLWGWSYDHSLINCTISGNSASSPGSTGGIHISQTSVVMINNIVWENQPLQMSAFSSTPSVSYCDIQGGWPGTGNINANPLFVSTAQNDYRLQWGSPCIDGGDPNPIYNDPDGTRADMGAFYFDQSHPMRLLLTPYNAPIVIPAAGGNFQYDIQCTNIDSLAHLVNVWCNVTLPNGSIYGPVLGPVNVNIGAGQTLSRLRTQIVPGAAPAGMYSYNAYAMVGADTSADSFSFAKLGSGAAGMAGWSNYGQDLQSGLDATAQLPLPSEYSLQPNFPNPFNPMTTIRFALPEAAYVHLVIYDISGRKVQTLADGWREAGTHEVTFDGADLSSGIYVYRLQAEGFTASGKMVLMK